MGADSKIEWTHHTFNPWWGCARVSPGCEHCYAESFAKRVGVKWGVQADRRFFGKKHWDEPLKWNKAAEKVGERRRVFCASMADVFEDREDLVEPRHDLWDLILATPCLDWLLLTKRPENLSRMLPWGDAGTFGEPFRNVWLGTTVEDQKRKSRIDELRRVPAAVRFLSIEPLLEDLGDLDLTGIDWVIVGGESGHHARSFGLDWARSIVRRCRDAGVAVHVKQLGASPYPGRIPRPEAGRVAYSLELLQIRHRKGGDWNEWPDDLRIREYPVAR